MLNAVILITRSAVCGRTKFIYRECHAFKYRTRIAVLCRAAFLIRYAVFGCAYDKLRRTFETYYREKSDRYKKYLSLVISIAQTAVADAANSLRNIVNINAAAIAAFFVCNFFLKN